VQKTEIKNKNKQIKGKFNKYFVQSRLVIIFRIFPIEISTMGIGHKGHFEISIVYGVKESLEKIIFFG
jgi:hypothetical protein